MLIFADSGFPDLSLQKGLSEISFLQPSGSAFPVNQPMNFRISDHFLKVPAAVLLIFLISGCFGRKNRLEKGYLLIEQGHFDAALQVFQKEYLQDDDDPQILSGYGYVLSLRRASMVAAMDFLERSIQLKPDPDVRRELIFLYMDAGLYDRAGRLIAPDRLSMDKYFEYETSVYRRGLDCMENPGRRTLSILRQLDESALRNYFLARCMFLDDFPKIPEEFLKEILDTFPDQKLRCDLEALMPQRLIKDAIRHGVIQKECDEKFPGSLVRNREKTESLAARDIKKLFDDSSLVPGEPVEQEVNNQAFGFKTDPLLEASSEKADASDAPSPGNQ